MLNKLRTKFTIAITAISAAMFVMLVCLTCVFLLNSYERESSRVMSGRSIIYNMTNTAPEEVWEIYARVYPSYFALYSAEGEPVFAYGQLTVDLADPAVRAEIYHTADEAARESGLIRRFGLRYLKREYSGYIMFTDATEELQARSRLMWGGVVLILAGCTILFFISRLLSRSLLHPTEQAWMQQKQFIADASHELKTPITVMLTNAELLTGEDMDREQQLRYSENILVTARQMRTLVERLLELVRLDSSSLRLMPVELDLSALARDALLPFDPLFFEKGLTLTSEIREGIRVMGSQTHLEQVIDILLDNAQKYATPGTEVRVTLTRVGKNCQLAVSNLGPEIPKEDLTNIFKRFYTRDKARTSGSYGLGLAIAEGIVTRHHGRIWAESQGGVNTFIVQIPLL